MQIEQPKKLHKTRKYELHNQKKLHKKRKCKLRKSKKTLKAQFKLRNCTICAPVYIYPNSAFWII